MIPAMGKGEAASAPPASAARHGRILVVDEAVPIRNTLVEILLKLGVAEGDVEQASSGDEALAAFRREVPHVVFAELVGVHPEDGLEIVHEMLDRAPQVRIVLVTAEARDSPEVRAAVRAGVFAIVEKPLRHEKIRQVLSDLAAEEGGIERFR
ncbi:MAG TPA: response regulator [Candidatus Thermoplasmatota archaeon]|nr:response regulator [Candidatus Thermoplasmatota archaeon]